MLTQIEASTQWYTCKLKREDGTPMPGASLLHVYATLTDVRTGAVINNRDGTTDLLGGEITVDSLGVLLWEMTPADTPYLGTGVKEVHELALKFEWAPNRVFYHRVRFELTNLAHVPAV